jgi:ribosomal protein S30
LTGRTGSARLPLSQLDPTGLVAMQLHAAADAATGSGGGGGGASNAAGSGSLLLLVSPSKRYFRGIATHVANAVRGVVQGYLVGVTVKGVGYRLEPADSSPAIAAPPGAPVTARKLFWEAGGEKTNVSYPHKQPSRVVRLKVRAAVFGFGFLGFLLAERGVCLCGAGGTLYLKQTPRCPHPKKHNQQPPQNNNNNNKNRLASPTRPSTSCPRASSRSSSSRPCCIYTASTRL